MFYERMKEKTVGEVVGILKEFSRTFIEENVDIGVFDFIRDFCEEDRLFLNLFFFSFGVFLLKQ